MLVIAKVVHGRRVAGLVTYLMGPGHAQEHVDPRVIATWDGRDAAWQPTDGDLGPLIRAMRAPVLAAGLDEHGEDRRRGAVWHLSVRVAAGDRVLSDGEWAAVVRELLDAAGVAARGDTGGPRWVAIRHADDHVHVAAVLVRQDTGRRFWPSNDYPRLRAGVRRIEQRLGLTSTARADRTAARAPRRAEIEKSSRQGRGPARTELARAVRAATVEADGPAMFVALLQERGYLVQLRRAPSGKLLGFTVGRPGDRTASGQQVCYSGSKLAPDLSLPALIRRWDAGTGGGAEPNLLDAARGCVDRAGMAVAADRRRGREGVGAIVHATGDVLTAVGGWSPELGRAADAFDRASRSPWHTSRADEDRSVALRRVARQLIRLGRHPWHAEPEPAAVALVVSLAAMVVEIAAWHRENGRAHQAAAAMRCRKSLRAAVRAAQPVRAGMPLESVPQIQPVGLQRQ